MKRLTTYLVNSSDFIANVEAAANPPTSQADYLNLLMKDRRGRSTLEASYIAKFLLKLSFFKQLHSDYDERTVKECAKVIYALTSSAGRNVITQGTLGHQYFIMLSGAASVYVDSSVTDSKGQPSTIRAKVGSVVPGSGFGELSLLTTKPRAATVVCDEECNFAVLDKADYLRILKKFDDRKLNSCIDFLKTLPLFCNWTRQSIAKLTYFFKETDYPRNSFVYKQGDFAKCVYFVKKGEFNLLKTLDASPSEIGKRKAKPRSVHVAILGVGEMVGSEEVLNNAKRQLSCQCASSQGQVFSIDKLDFLRRIAYTSSMKALAEQRVVREEVHQRRLDEAKQSLLIHPPKQPRKSQASRTVKGSRSLSKASLPKSTTDSSVSLSNLSFESNSTKVKQVRTMTNLPRLPELSYSLSKSRLSASPIRTHKRDVVRNIHMKALRDKHLSYYDHSPYVQFLKQT